MGRGAGGGGDAALDGDGGHRSHGVATQAEGGGGGRRHGGHTGTLAAGRRLIEARGAEVVGAACLLELTALGGRAVVPDTHVLFAA